MVSVVSSFVTRSSLVVPPPARPPWRRGYGQFGQYCLKATCDLVAGDETVGRVVGYDRYVSVAAEVEHACSIKAREHRGASCSPARVALLNEFRKECSGEVFFVLDGTSTRLV